MNNSRFINRKTIPTTCKFCGKRVFYHTNDYGSKVFFDELGGTWPIHECSGYFLAKSVKENYYSGISGKFPRSGIPLSTVKKPSKPQVILIKKGISWESA